MLPLEIILGDNEDPFCKFIPRMMIPRVVMIMMMNKNRLFSNMIDLSTSAA